MTHQRSYVRTVTHQDTACPSWWRSDDRIRLLNLMSAEEIALAMEQDPLWCLPRQCASRQPRMNAALALMNQQHDREVTAGNKRLLKERLAS